MKNRIIPQVEVLEDKLLPGSTSVLGELISNNKTSMAQSNAPPCTPLHSFTKPVPSQLCQAKDDSNVQDKLFELHISSGTGTRIKLSLCEPLSAIEAEINSKSDFLLTESLTTADSANGVVSKFLNQFNNPGCPTFPQSPFAFRWESTANTESDSLTHFVALIVPSTKSVDMVTKTPYGDDDTSIGLPQFVLEGRGNVDLIFWPDPMGAPIPEDAEQGNGKPGVLINVNWDDDDGDGWTNGGIPPNAQFTPDKDDANLITGGDNDLMFARLYVLKGPADPGTWNGSVTITYGSHIKLFSTDTKEGFIPSGTTINVNDLTPESVLSRYKQLYVEGYSVSGQLKDTTITANYTGTMQLIRTTDLAEFTAIEVSMEAFTAYGKQNTENQLKFDAANPPGSSNHTGKISWDDYDGDIIPDEQDTLDDNGNPVPNDRDLKCEYFRNCIEIMGVVRPSLVVPPPPLGQPYPVDLLVFDFKRDIQEKSFTKARADASWGLPTSDKPAWTPDDTSNSSEQLTPNSQNHIFAIDAPGVLKKTVNAGELKELVSLKQNFRQYVTVSIYGQPAQQCSDFLKWKSQIYLTEKYANGNPQGVFTRDGGFIWNKLNTGWLTNIDNPNDHNDNDL